MRKSFDIIDIKEQKSENFLGYSGTIINVKIKDSICEIQINTPQMIFAKEKEEIAKKLLGKDLFDKIKDKLEIQGGLGHEFYEKFRTSDSLKEKEKIEKLSKAYYEKIRKIKI